ncbi:MAG TPA: gliding motility-associated C-terminal domain-containing protein, partial [Bacteroidetes bacterium]|nr:gliding motility-associated C-terminal domain-containing protein [Bacteroidota bacterium]
FAPNAFTPDGDGVNDVFLPEGTFDGVKEFTMYVYNRWGEEIFISNDISVGWDGTFNKTDIMAPNGCYVYLIIVRDYLGRIDEYKGVLFKLE